MPNRLHRYYGAGYSYFYHQQLLRRLPLLGSSRNRDLFLRVLEQVRFCELVAFPDHKRLRIRKVS